MAQRTTEIIVGLFMIAGCAALLVLALQVSGLSPKSAESTYTTYANFNDTGGLTPRGQGSPWPVSRSAPSGVHQPETGKPSRPG